MIPPSDQLAVARATRLDEEQLEARHLASLVWHPLSAQLLRRRVDADARVRMKLRDWLERSVAGLRWRVTRRRRDAETLLRAHRLGFDPPLPDTADAPARQQDALLTQLEARYVAGHSGASCEHLRHAARGLHPHDPALFEVALRLRRAGAWDAACDRLPTRYRRMLDLVVAPSRGATGQESDEAVRAAAGVLAGRGAATVAELASGLAHPSRAIREMVIAALAHVADPHASSNHVAH